VPLITAQLTVEQALELARALLVAAGAKGITL